MLKFNIHLTVTAWFEVQLISNKIAYNVYNVWSIDFTMPAPYYHIHVERVTISAQTFVITAKLVKFSSVLWLVFFFLLLICLIFLTSAAPRLRAKQSNILQDFYTDSVMTFKRLSVYTVLYKIIGDHSKIGLDGWSSGLGGRLYFDA